MKTTNIKMIQLDQASNMPEATAENYSISYLNEALWLVYENDGKVFLEIDLGDFNEATMNWYSTDERLVGDDEYLVVIVNEDLREVQHYTNQEIISMAQYYIDIVNTGADSQLTLF